ncbi:MAG TPA: hypothetical protein VI934_00950 [Candidatus Nanoarchaeia archaeon]|nr:hypothetical protein [Candidatus Nanoarchaeia archaeon]
MLLFTGEILEYPKPFNMLKVYQQNMDSPLSPELSELFATYRRITLQKRDKPLTAILNRTDFANLESSLGSMEGCMANLEDIAKSIGSNVGTVFKALYAFKDIGQEVFVNASMAYACVSAATQTGQQAIPELTQDNAHPNQFGSLLAEMQQKWETGKRTYGAYFEHELATKSNLTVVTQLIYRSFMLLNFTCPKTSIKDWHLDLLGMISPVRQSNAHARKANKLLGLAANHLENCLSGLKGMGEAAAYGQQNSGFRVDEHVVTYTTAAAGLANIVGEQFYVVRLLKCAAERTIVA